MWSPLKKVKMWSSVRKTAGWALAAMAIVVCGFIVYEFSFVLNVAAMTVSLFAGVSILIGREQKKSHILLNAFAVSAFAIIVFTLSFAYLQQFVALCTSLFVLWMLIKLSLFKDHDAGWFGALAVQFIALLFSMLIFVALGITQHLLF